MKTRFSDISLLRVVAMIMVVYYHCICPYYIWGGIDNAGVSVPLYTKLSVALNMVHLPIFFLVAGYLFGYKRIKGGGTPINGSSLLIRRSVC